MNRLTQKTYPDSTSVEYVYDLVGKVMQVNDPTGTYGFAYDNMGRLIGTTTSYSFLPNQTFSNAYSYDAASNRTGFTAPDGSTNSYSYDTLNRLNNLTNSLTGSFGFSYDALSRRTQLTRPNGVNTNYAYDNLSRLLSVLHQSGSTTLDGANYNYDSVGNRVSKTNYLNNVTEGYSYDPLYQLTQVTQGASTTESYSYDAVGNRLSSLGVSPYSYNSSNELTATPSTSYAYDYNGNTTSKTDSGGTTNYTWDYENQLLQVTLPGSGGTVTFKYDPFGRRIQKSVSSSPVNYTYDDANIVQELDSSGNTLSRYVQGLGIDEPLTQLRGGTTGYFQRDGLGSSTSISDWTQAFANTYTFDTFGKQTGSTGAPINPFQYTGRDFDSETGLSYFRNRYYDPNLGRFISQDPIGFEGGMNVYSYVENDPVNEIDPLGLQGVTQYFNPWQFRDWILSFEHASQRTEEFLEGNGPTSYTYGPGSQEVNDMMYTPGVYEARDLYARCGQKSGHYEFAPKGHRFKGIVESGMNPTAQFVGGYDWSISPNSDGTITVTLTNTTDVRSLIYHILPLAWPRKPNWSPVNLPLGTTTQVYHWTESSPGGGKKCGCGK